MRNVQEKYHGGLEMILRVLRVTWTMFYASTPLSSEYLRVSYRAANGPNMGLPYFGIRCTR
jgi:hypothetical protein